MEMPLSIQKVASGGEGGDKAAVPFSLLKAGTKWRSIESSGNMNDVSILILFHLVRRVQHFW